MNALTRAAAWSLAAPAAYSLIEPHLLRVHRFEVALSNLPIAADGLRVAHLSDLHCSAITSAKVLRRAVDECNALKPDVVVLTGDYVSRRDSYFRLSGARQLARPVMEYAREMGREVERLQALQGVYAVFGNHDHSQERVDAIDDVLKKHGVTTLLNRSIRLPSGLPIIGFDDLRAGRPLIKTACDGVSADEAQLMLSHNPRLIGRVQERNALMLAGHTHGGQVHLPMTSFRRRPGDMRGAEWTQGWYQAGRARLYVNSGVGSVWFPMRFRCPPEIAVFTLRVV